MKGSLTYQDLDRQKQAEQNVKDALAYLEGRQLCDYCLKVQEILRRGIEKSRVYE